MIFSSFLNDARHMVHTTKLSVFFSLSVIVTWNNKSRSVQLVVFVCRWPQKDPHNFKDVFDLIAGNKE